MTREMLTDKYVPFITACLEELKLTSSVELLRLNDALHLNDEVYDRCKSLAAMIAPVLEVSTNNYLDTVLGEQSIIFNSHSLSERYIATKLMDLAVKNFLLTD